MAENSQWMSIGEAAKFLGISRDTLRRWEKRGRIKPVRSPTNRRYYTRKQLDKIRSGEFEDSKEESPKKAPKGRQVKSKKPRRPKPKIIAALVGIVSFIITVAIAAGVLFLVL
ncbi:MerR family DNA-binding transcriptional regulator [Patescibacteria group bacterium]